MYTYRFLSEILAESICIVIHAVRPSKSVTSPSHSQLQSNTVVCLPAVHKGLNKELFLNTQNSYILLENTLHIFKPGGIWLPASQT